MNRTCRHYSIAASALLAATCSLSFLPAGAAAHPDAATTRPSEAQMTHAGQEMAQAAHNFWAALTPEEQKVAGFEMNDQERLNWHFIPRERKGLTWKAMTSAQQALGHALLVSGLSQRGYAKAETVMSLEQVLADIEKDKGKFKRDPENYAFSIFGKPAPTGAWGWRVEGHHLSLNFTIVDGKAIAGGPIFMGANPAEVREGPRKGLRLLGPEEDIGFKIVHGLSDAQKAKAIVAKDAPSEIITGNARKAHALDPIGIAAGELKPEQKEMIVHAVKMYAHRLRDELAEDDLRRIEQAGWDKVQFAWAGGTEPGVGHYYRLQGPTFLVEFDNTQNDANHIHTVWRDLTNDFGEDILREHYDADHKEQKAR